MPMHDSPHPGGIIRRQCLEPLGLSVTEAAAGLGVTRQALSDLLNGKAGVSVDMAIRLRPNPWNLPGRSCWLLDPPRRSLNGFRCAHDHADR